MSYRCATCGGNHRKPETARRCAEQAAARGSRERARDVKYASAASSTHSSEFRARERAYDNWATSREERESGSLETVTNQNWDANLYGEPPNVPNGHYFIDTEYWTPNGIHVWFRKFDTGRWANVWFVTAFEEDGKPEVMGGHSDREFVYAKLCSAGPAECMVRYGRLFSRCGICNEEITEEEREAFGGHEGCLAAAFRAVKI